MYYTIVTVSLTGKRAHDVYIIAIHQVNISDFVNEIS